MKKVDLQVKELIRVVSGKKPCYRCRSNRAFSLSARFRAKYASIVSKPLQEPRKDKRDTSVFNGSSMGVTKIRAFPVGISGGTSRVIRWFGGTSTVCSMVIGQR